MSTSYSNAQPERQTRKGLAIASLTLGVISIPTLGLLVVGAVTGIVLGAIALNRIRKEPLTYGGKGMAIAGIVTSAFSLLLTAFFGMLAAIAVPKLNQEIKTGREVAAASSLVTIYENQMRFKETNSRFATLENWLRRDFSIKPTLVERRPAVMSTRLQTFQTRPFALTPTGPATAPGHAISSSAKTAQFDPKRRRPKAR